MAVGVVVMAGGGLVAAPAVANDASNEHGGRASVTSPNPTVDPGIAKRPAVAVVSGSSSEKAVLDGPKGKFEVEQIQQKDHRGLKLHGAKSNLGGTGTDDGEVLFSSSVLDSQEASVEYALTLPESVTAKLATDGVVGQSVLLLDADGELVGGVAPGEVFDANGVAVPTTFEIDGAIISHSLAPEAGTDVAYPVTMGALAGTVWYSSAYIGYVANKGYTVNANPTALGRTQIAWNLHWIHVDHLKTVLGTNQAWHVNWNIEQQFICHVVGAYFPSGTYNMEKWQPSLAWQLIANPWDRCNRIK